MLQRRRKVAGLMSAGRFGVLVALVLVATARTARGQDLEPRAYSPSPVGTNFLAVVLGMSQGEVLFDPAVPITDAEARLYSTTVGYARSFGLGGRQGLVGVVLPFAQGNFEGTLFNESRATRHLSGLADVRVKMSLNLLGSRAMTREEFAKAPRKTILGVSLTVQAPTGEYDETKLINLGTNRWAFKPEVGVSVPVGRWHLDIYGGAWFFTNNDAFFKGNSTLRQDPIATIQGHASYTFKSRAWLALDATWYGGGEATVDENKPSTRQNNTRLGGTFALPVAKGQSVKFAASTGASARTGSNFQTYLVGWQYMWFDRPSGGKS